MRTEHTKTNTFLSTLWFWCSVRQKPRNAKVFSCVSVCMQRRRLSCHNMYEHRPACGLLCVLCTFVCFFRLWFFSVIGVLCAPGEWWLFRRLCAENVHALHAREMRTACFVFDSEYAHLGCTTRGSGNWTSTICIEKHMLTLYCLSRVTYKYLFLYF